MDDDYDLFLDDLHGVDLDIIPSLSQWNSPPLSSPLEVKLETNEEGESTATVEEESYDLGDDLADMGEDFVKYVDEIEEVLASQDICQCDAVPPKANTPTSTSQDSDVPKQEPLAQILPQKQSSGIAFSSHVSPSIPKEPALVKLSSIAYQFNGNQPFSLHGVKTPEPATNKENIPVLPSPRSLHNVYLNCLKRKFSIPTTSPASKRIKTESSSQMRRSPCTPHSDVPARSLDDDESESDIEIVSEHISRLKRPNEFPVEITAEFIQPKKPPTPRAHIETASKLSQTRYVKLSSIKTEVDKKPNFSLSPEPPATQSHIEEFFSTFRTMIEPFWTVSEQFHRLCRAQRWERGDSRQKRAWDDYRTALVNDFNAIYGTDVSDIQPWHALCRDLDISPIPFDLESCRWMVRNTHANIVDLIDYHLTTRKRPQIFKTLDDLREYTKSTHKYFPLNHAKAGGVLKYLLRHIFEPES